MYTSSVGSFENKKPFLKKGDAGTSLTCKELVVKKYLNELPTSQCLTNQSSLN